MTTPSRATFSALKCSDPSVFAIRISGQLGTRQRKVVEELVRKCKANQKTRVLFDFSELESLGGVIAAILGRFCDELSKAGTPPRIVGASPVVRSFLQARFPASPPAFADSVEDAVAMLTGATPAPPPEPNPAPAPAAEPEPIAAAPASTPEAPRPAPEDSGPRPPCYSLPQAERLLTEARTPADRKDAISGLLYSANLAETCFLLHRAGERFVEADDPALSLPAGGALARLIAGAAGPLPIVDLDDPGFEAEELDTLQRINCQMVVPLLRNERLEGILFFRKTRAGDEYEAGEALALDLLGRLWGGDADAGAAKAEDLAAVQAKLKHRAHRNQTLARLGREFNAVSDEGQLLNLVLLTVMGEMGVTSAAYFALDSGRLRPHCARAIELSRLPDIPVEGQPFEAWTEVVRIDEAEGAPAAILKALDAVGLPTALPIHQAGQVLGLVALGPVRDNESRLFDPRFLKSIVDQAAVALTNAMGIREMHHRTLKVARTILSLAGRGGEDAMGNDRAAYYVGRVAQELNYPAEDLRDLIYGTVLRDVGMIQISDLVIRSPRRLTPEEWKLVQRHPMTGAEILRSMGFGELASEIVLHHHERFNGEGYPNGLRAHAIPLGARIVAVVESYLAMTRDLPYRAALSQEEALDVIRENWELRYDPEVVEAFVAVVESTSTADREPELDDLLALV